MAYNAYIPNVFNFMNPDGRSPIRMPKSINDQQIKNAIEFVKSRDIKQNDVFYYQNKPIANQENYRNGVINNGKWVNLPDNSGIILTDEMGSPVQRMIDGHLTFVGFKFREILNNNSMLSEKIDKMEMDKNSAAMARSMKQF